MKQDKNKKNLSLAALFLGEVRDGLTMINMQSAFLIVSKMYTEKQAGMLFLVFGLSQFLFQTPAGYLFDYTEKKILWFSLAAIGTTSLTVATALFAEPYGGNFALMVWIKFFQGAITAFIPPGLNSIAQGIVGASGMTDQVSKNEMMNHLGTAINVLCGSLIGVWFYPDLATLFVVSPIACAGFLFFLYRIKADDIDHAEARGLVKKPETPRNASNAVELAPKDYGTNDQQESSEELKADSPLQVLRDPALVTFILIVFLFHTSNATVLPLVMQTLAIGSGRIGILMSGLCIIIAQLVMVPSAKICGTFSGQYGRKVLFNIGFFSLPIRCFILYFLLLIRGENDSTLMSVLILATEVLDGIGAGFFGTMYVLVTSDLSRGTGRFSMILGLTTAAVSIGGTVSGYLGEYLAEDIGYKETFLTLGFMAAVPALLYMFIMPETLVVDEGHPYEEIKDENGETSKRGTV